MKRSNIYKDLLCEFSEIRYPLARRLLKSLIMLLDREKPSFEAIDESRDMALEFLKLAFIFDDEVHVLANGPLGWYLIPTAKIMEDDKGDGLNDEIRVQARTNTGWQTIPFITINEVLSEMPTRKRDISRVADGFGIEQVREPSDAEIWELEKTITDAINKQNSKQPMGLIEGVFDES